MNKTRVIFQYHHQIVQIFTLSSIIFQENAQAVNKVGTVQGVTTNTNAKSLAETDFSGLVHSLVGKSTGTRDDTDLTTLVNVTRHDTYLALIRSNDTWAVGTNKTRLALGQKCLLDLDHVVLGNTFSDGNNQGNFSFDGFQNGSSSARRGNVDNTGISLGCLSSLLRSTINAHGQCTKETEAEGVGYFTSRTVAKTGRPRWV
jgi:hypothetical protein